MEIDKLPEVSIWMSGSFSDWKEGAFGVPQRSVPDHSCSQFNVLAEAARYEMSQSAGDAERVEGRLFTCNFVALQSVHSALWGCSGGSHC